MEACYSLISAPALTSSFGSPPFQKAKLHHHRRTRLVGFSCNRDAYDRDSGGRLVDESMIVLRKRIHEMKVAEGNYETPSEWMDWEKRYYASYGSDVSQLLGMFQAFFLNTRPGLAFGLAAIITVAVPATVVFAFHLFMSLLAHCGAT